MSPPNPPVNLIAKFNQAVAAFNNARFDTVGSVLGLNDLVAPQAGFTHLHSDKHEPNALQYFQGILPGPTFQPQNPQVDGWTVHGDGTWTATPKGNPEPIFFVFTFAPNCDDGSPWLVQMAARLKAHGRHVP